MDPRANVIAMWARRGLLVLGGMAAVGAAWAAYDLQTGPAPLLDPGGALDPSTGAALSGPILLAGAELSEPMPAPLATADLEPPLLPLAPAAPVEPALL
jgi:hypothetical protein